MRDRPVIFAGLAIFLAAASFPFWFNTLAGRKAAAPELTLPPPGRTCVAPKAFMRTGHMKLLDTWRDQVVREGIRDYRDGSGNLHEMSLNRTCLARCHQNRKEFCDRCHAYAGLPALSCWDCHDAPAGTLRRAR